MTADHNVAWHAIEDHRCVAHRMAEAIIELHHPAVDGDLVDPPRIRPFPDLAVCMLECAQVVRTRNKRNRHWCGRAIGDLDHEYLRNGARGVAQRLLAPPPDVVLGIVELNGSTPGGRYPVHDIAPADTKDRLDHRHPLHQALPY